MGPSVPLVIRQMYFLTFILVLVVCAMTAVIGLCRQRHMDRWLIPYLRGLTRGVRPRAGTTHLLVCVCDHYEPAWNHVSIVRERERVAVWAKRLPELASRHRDAENRPFQYTFFYPEEQYRDEHLDQLARICKDGYGDVEIHLHHDSDTADGVTQKLIRFKTLLH